MKVQPSSSQDLDLGNGLRGRCGGWSFSGEVARAFSEHVRQSVPLYEEGHRVVADLSTFFMRADGLGYDLGMSTGDLLTRLVDANVAKPRSRWVGIDVEPDMVSLATDRLRGQPNVELVCADIVDHEFQPCDFIVAYYTLQFLSEESREEVVRRCCRSLHRGGAFVLFEKVRSASPKIQDMVGAMYQDYKLTNGYSPDEVVNKARSLRGVLQPLSSEENVSMLGRCGFATVVTVTKLLCFEGFLAIK